MAHVAARDECHVSAEACRRLRYGFAKLHNFEMVREAQARRHDRSLPSRFSDKPKRDYCAVVERQVGNWSCSHTTLRGLMSNLSRKRCVVREIHTFLWRAKRPERPAKPFAGPNSKRFWFAGRMR